MFWKKIIAIFLCMVAVNHTQSMQQTNSRSLTFLQQIAHRTSIIQNNFNVLYQNNVYNVTFTRAKVFNNVMTKYEVKLVRHINTDQLGTILCNMQSTPMQSMNQMFILAPQQQISTSGTQLQVVANIPMPDQICNATQAIRKITDILHGQEHLVLNPLLSNKQFAQRQMGNMDLESQLQRQHTQEILLDVMFPSRILAANAAASMETISTVLQDGIQVQSPILLKDTIDRLAPAVECITQYATAAIQDRKNLDAMQGQNSQQIIQNLGELQVIVKDLLQQQQDKYTSALAAQQANTAAFMAQHEPLPLSDKINLIAELGKAKTETQFNLAAAQKNLDQQKAAISGLTTELNLYQQGYSVDNLSDTMQLFVTEFKKGFPGTSAEKQTLTTAKQEAVQSYLAAHSNVDFLSNKLSQQTAIHQALQTSQSAQRAHYDQVIKTGSLQDLFAAAETINKQIADAKHGSLGEFSLQQYKGNISAAIESKIYTPAYKQLLHDLRDNKTIINSPERLAALNKALEKHSLSQICYQVSPELGAYLTSRGIPTSEFQIIIADPLRGQIFKENLLLLHKIEQKFLFNSSHDTITQARIDSLVRANHDVFSALFQGDIEKAAAFTNSALKSYVQLQQQQPIGNTRAQNTTPSIMRDPPVKLGTQITLQTVDSTQTGPQGSYPLDITRQNTVKVDKQQLQEIFKRLQADQNLSATDKLFQALYNTEIMQRVIGTLEGPGLGVLRGIDPKRIATNICDAVLTNLKAAFIEQMVEDMGDRAMVDAIFGTNMSQHDEQLLVACVLPIADDAVKSWQEFKSLSPREQNKMLSAFIFEQIVAAKVLSVGGQVLGKAGSGIAEFATIEKAPLATTSAEIEISGTAVVETTAPVPTIEPVVTTEGKVATEAEVTAKPEFESSGVTPAVKTDAIATQSQKFTNFAEGRLKWHYEDHVLDRAEWGSGSTMTMEEYLTKAQELINSPIGGDIEGFVSKNGYIFRYNKATNEFATAKPNGIIETLYRPERGMTYWREQIAKYK